MWMNFNIAGLALASLVAGQMASAGFSTAQAIQMAQNTAMPDRLPGRDVLVAGAGTIADGKSPATVMIDIGEEAIPARPKLELTLAPATIVPNEKYLIVVSIKPREGPPKRLGATSFFPARAGADTVFYFDAAPIVAEMKSNQTRAVQLSVALVPADRSKELSVSALRIVGARLIKG